MGCSESCTNCSNPGATAALVPPGDDERRRVEDFWDSGKSLDFYFFRPDTIREKLTQNGSG
jgi:hypothetical protein